MNARKQIQSNRQPAAKSSENSGRDERICGSTAEGSGHANDTRHSADVEPPMTTFEENRLFRALAGPLKNDGKSPFKVLFSLVLRVVDDKHPLTERGLSVKVGMAEMMASAGLTKNTVRCSRRELKKANLLDYTVGGRDGMECTEYRLVFAYPLIAAGPVAVEGSGRAAGSEIDRGSSCDPEQVLPALQIQRVSADASLDRQLQFEGFVLSTKSSIQVFSNVENPAPNPPDEPKPKTDYRALCKGWELRDVEAHLENQIRKREPQLKKLGPGRDNAGAQMLVAANRAGFDFVWLKTVINKFWKVRYDVDGQRRLFTPAMDGWGKLINAVKAEVQKAGGGRKPMAREVAQDRALRAVAGGTGGPGPEKRATGAVGGATPVLGDNGDAFRDGLLGLLSESVTMRDSRVKKAGGINLPKRRSGS